MGDIIARSMAARNAKFTNGGEVYNAENGLRNFRVALASAGTKPLNIACVGDSITYGYYASDYTNKSWVGRLRTLLQSKYGNMGTGWMPLPSPNSPDSNPWTFTGWYQILGQGVAGEFYQSNGAGNTVTLTFTGTQLSVVYSTGGGGASTSTVKIDGTTVAPINFSGSNAYGNVQTYTGLTAGSHTLQITTASGLSWIEGAIALDTSGGSNNCVVHRVGRPSALSRDFYSTASRLVSALNNPNLVILAFGINDSNPSVTDLPSYYSNMGTIISAFQAQNASVLLLAYPIGNISGQWLSNYQTVIAMQYQLADQYNCALLDLNPRWQSWTSAQALGLYGDGTLDGLSGSDTWHPSDVGHRDIANAIAMLLVGQTT